MRQYTLERRGNLLLARCAVRGETGIVRTTVLVDTGSTHTILPWEALEKIGCMPSVPREKVRIVTANGPILVPRVQVKWINAVGTTVQDFVVAAHTLPAQAYVDGLLGMDFLVRAHAVISTHIGLIQVD